MQGSFCRPPTRRVRQKVEATVALQGTPGLLIGLGAFLAGAALAAFLVTAIPVLLVCTDTLCITPAGRHMRMAIRLLSKSLRLLQSVKRAARAVEVMLYTVERELPETAAAMRLSSMELSDAIEEVTLLR